MPRKLHWTQTPAGKEILAERSRKMREAKAPRPATNIGPVRTGLSGRIRALEDRVTELIGLVRQVVELVSEVAEDGTPRR